MKIQVILSLYPMGNADGTYSWTAIPGAGGSSSSDSRLEIYGVGGKSHVAGKWSLNEHLKFVDKNKLSSNDSWEIIEVGGGNVVFKNPKRGYLLAGIKHPQGNILQVGYHQNERTATKFKKVKAHKGDSSWSSYQMATPNRTPG